MILSLHNGADTVTVYSYFLEAGTTTNTVDTIEFADGTVWNYEHIRVVWNAAPVSIGGFATISGTNGNDTINGTSGGDFLSGEKGDDIINANAGNDVIYGGIGNDALNGGNGDDTYIWNWGEGLDTIYDTGNNDTISFGDGITFNDLTFQCVNTDDLKIFVKNDPNQGVIIQDFLNGSLNYKIEELIFRDGSEVHLSEIALTLQQLSTGETITGTAFGDTIYAGGGFDTVNAGSGNDTIYGGSGNDYLNGGNGDDTYVYNVGDGLDTIYDYESSSSSGKNDKIKFGEGISATDVTLSRKDNNLVITLFNDITQGVIIQDFFYNSYYQIEKIEFSDGTIMDLTGGLTLRQADGNDNITGTSLDDVIYGNGGNDTLNGGNGNDTIIGGKDNDNLQGEYGNDTYVWNLGDGLDYISDSSGNNIIEFGEGITLENLTFNRGNSNDPSDANNLYIFVNDDRNQGIKIDYFFGLGTYRNFTLKFADGSTFVPQDNDFNFTLAEGVNTLYGFDYNDTLTGNNQENTISGGNGNDTIIGGKGNDNLQGEYGNDTYVWNLGDGLDYISDNNGNNIIEFGKGITLENLTFERGNSNDSSNANNLYIFVNDDRNQGIIINYFFGLGTYRNFTLKFADGSTFVPKDNDFNFTLPEGQNTLYGFDYNDTLTGNNQENTISGGNGNDTIIGGKGNDNLQGEYGNDTYVWNLGDGLDYISDNNGNNIIEFGEGITLENLTFERGNSNDSSNANNLYIFVNDDRNQGIIINYFFGLGTYRNFTLKFADGSTFVPKDNDFNFTLPEGQNTLYGFDYNDTLTGNNQENTISGGNGNDTIIGGKGNDNLQGEYGNDTYVWNLGDGLDYISDNNGNNIIEFGEGITLENLTFERGNSNDPSDANNLYIFVNDDRNQGIKIDYFFGLGTYRNFTLKFSDGSTFVPKDNDFNFTLAEGVNTLYGFDYNDTLTGNNQENTISGGNGNDTLIGGKGNDTLKGEGGNDTYIWNLGDGFDYINDSNDNNIIEFGEGITLENLTFERSNENDSTYGYDLYIFVNGDRNQGLQLYYFFGSSSYQNFTLKFADGSTTPLTTDISLSQLPEVNLTLNGTADDDILTGGTGHDIINAGDGYNDITGGQGNDTITGGYDRDTYYYNLGDGFDTITDPNGKDQIIFGEGISKDDLTLRRNGNDLWLIINDDLTQGMKLVNFFASDDNKIETLKFSDNSSINLATAGLTLDQWDTDDNITGTSYDDIIYGNDGKDTLSGGSGKDILIGGHGNDTLYGGAGNDTYRWNSGDDFDTIEDNSGQNSVEFGDGIDFDDLTFTKIGENLYITINDNPTEGLNLSKFFNSDGYKNFTLKFKDGTQYILNENGLTFSQGDTFDTINGTNFNDVIYANDGNDTVNTLAGNDTVYGGKGNDVIDAGNGNDTLTGGEGNDSLTGGAGDDTYIYNLGDGFDTISDADGTDKIILGTGITADMLSFSREGNDLRIIISNDKLQGFLLKNQFAAGTSKIESIEFSNNSTLSLINKGFTFNQNNIDETISGTDFNDTINAAAGNDTVNAGEGDDTITGGLGNDNLNGGNGDDTYIYNIGDGLDTITETSGADKIVLGTGIALENLRFIREGNNLRILINNNVDQGFLLVNQFAGADTRIEQLQFADNSVLDLVNDSLTFEQYNGGETINGTDNDDTIYGRGGNDTIDAGDGDDTIVGGIGDDTLSGGYGRDTYIYNLGDGADTINETRGNDIIKFGAGITQDDLTFTQEGNNLKILIDNDPYQSILINNFYSNVNNQVEKLQFADGSTFNLSTQGLTLTQNNGDETINGTGYNDVIYGNGGHDTINAGEGNDTIVGGIGNDILNGGNGDDTYIYNLGDGFDTITESGGNDKIVFGEGISQRDLSFEKIGNDLKISINGNEVKGIQINDHFRYDSSKVETIEFHDGSTLDISNADQLIQAMNSFSVSNSASTDTLSNPTEDVSDMYSLAASQDLTRKAI
ncbi:MAG: calcium-binding protein [Alphaproteobacteria bacterium]